MQLRSRAREVMWSTRAVLLSAALALVPLTGCDDGMGPHSETLRLAFTGLEPLSNGFHYEGWAILAGSPVSTGKFNVATGGGLVTPGGTPIAGGEFATGMNLEAATAIVITIEPAGDVDAVPAATKILAGSVANASATLSIAAPQALGTDFASAMGRYILATPTDGMNNNETSGIWFISLQSGSPAAGLALPTLPSGWRYEGWAVIDGRPVTTGTFTSVSAADAAAPYSGPQAGPPFPGEDFIVNAPAGLTFPTNLSGGMAVISVEPMPDDSPAPFTVKPLAGSIPSGAMDRVTYTMNLNAASSPTGTATIR